MKVAVAVPGTGMLEEQRGLDASWIVSGSDPLVLSA
jgi:hypothetical protein